MSDETKVTGEGAKPGTGWAGWLVGPGFALMACWLVWGAPKAEVPAGPAVRVTAAEIAPGARRTPKGGPPGWESGGYVLACVECHRLIDVPTSQHRPMAQHTEIVLRHGMNNNCFNCHHRKERDRLALYTGETIGFDEVPRLCSQCHGTVFRDWERGTHGKTLGSWDASSGKQVRLGCNECHDPHSPAYPRVVPLPAPRTLRLGVRAPYGETHADGHEPLREGAERGHEHGPASEGGHR